MCGNKNNTFGRTRTHTLRIRRIVRSGGGETNVNRAHPSLFPAVVNRWGWRHKQLHLNCMPRCLTLGTAPHIHKYMQRCFGPINKRQTTQFALPEDRHNMTRKCACPCSTCFYSSSIVSPVTDDPYQWPQSPAINC